MSTHFLHILTSLSAPVYRCPLLLDLLPLGHVDTLWRSNPFGQDNWQKIICLLVAFTQSVKLAVSIKSVLHCDDILQCENRYYDYSHLPFRIIRKDFRVNQILFHNKITCKSILTNDEWQYKELHFGEK